MRTTSELVQGVLLQNYDAKKRPDLAPFIATASSVVDVVVPLAADPGRNFSVALSAATQELIERWLTAHFYLKADPLYMSRSTAGASGSFQRKVGEGFESTEYGCAAVNLDPSGALSAIGKRQFAGGFWLGKNPTEQIDYEERR